MRRRVRDRLSYANVMATIAVFIALGGTSYALSLPRNSVGAAELRPNSVGRSEIKRNAVRSQAIRNQSVRLRDLAGGARKGMRGDAGPPGPQGPPGPTFAAAVDSGGGLARGNATTSNPAGIGRRLIGFSRDVSDCVATATLAEVPGGVPVIPEGHVTVAQGSAGRVLVKTWDAEGNATELPFHLIVAC